MVTVSGQQLECAGTGDVQLAVPGCRAVTVSALVVREKPLGFGVIMGMDAVQALGGVTVRSPSDVQFVCEETSVACVADAEEPPRKGELKVEKEDFCVTFDLTQRRWIVSWKWAGGSPPSELSRGVGEYPVPAEARAEYEAELDIWIKEGWLREYEKAGSAQGIDTVDGGSAEDKSAAGIGFQIPESPCDGLHGRRGRVCRAVAQVATDGDCRGAAGLEEGVSAGPRGGGSLAVPDRPDQGKKVRADKARLRTKRRAVSHADGAGHGCGTGLARRGSCLDVRGRHPGGRGHGACL